MKLPRNVDGDSLAHLLNRYGYRIDHQTGSHQRLSAVIRGKTHNLTIPRHKPLRVGTLHGILERCCRTSGDSSRTPYRGIVWMIPKKTIPVKRVPGIRCTSRYVHRQGTCFPLKYRGRT
ncbi:MAG: type II toxin-antitoxin system HicA family toxin [Methanomicrobiales archaeon]|nr:type II toxin-antitoxin system HicA family toxin [Methanomicrobiales archaeon]